MAKKPSSPASHACPLKFGFTEEKIRTQLGKSTSKAKAKAGGRKKIVKSPAGYIISRQKKNEINPRFEKLEN
jgi:hypothetical protein